MKRFAKIAAKVRKLVMNNAGLKDLMPSVRLLNRSSVQQLTSHLARLTPSCFHIVALHAIPFIISHMDCKKKIVVYECHTFKVTGDEHVAQ